MRMQWGTLKLLNIARVRYAKSKAWKNVSKIFYENNDKPIADTNNIGKYLHINYTY